MGPCGPERDEQTCLDHEAASALAHILGRPPASCKVPEAQATAGIVGQGVANAPHMTLPDDSYHGLASINRLAPFEAPCQVQVACRTNEA